MKKLNKKWVTRNPATRLYNMPVPIVALTGGIATGKSTIAEFFRNEDIPVIDADRLVKGIYSTRESFDFVHKNFPMAITEDKINFKTLREMAFRTPENQLMLETFIYAQMHDAFKTAYSTLPEHEFIVYDVPLLFEKQLDEKVDVSICAYSPRYLQRERLIRRDHISVELAETILAKQMDIEEKKRKSDLYIENTSSMEALGDNFKITLGSLTC